MNKKDSIGYMVAMIIDEGYDVKFQSAASGDVRCVVTDAEGGLISGAQGVGVYNALLDTYCKTPLLSRKPAVPDGQLTFAPDVAPVGEGE